MGWEGQVGAGLSFLIIGLFHGRAALKSMGSSASKRIPAKNSITDLEHLLIALLSVVHILTSFVQAHKDGAQGYDVSMALVLERSGVASLFMFYGLVSLIADKTRLLPLPQEALHLFALIAFGLEFVFFYLGGDGDGESGGVVGMYHHLMLVIIGACGVTKILEIVNPRSSLAPLVHSGALIFQGTWFFQMAISLFGSPFIAKGCHLDQKGEADYALKCEGMSSMRAKAIATLQFNNHMAIILLFLLPLYSFMRKGVTVPPTYEPLGDSEGSLQGKELLNMKSRVPEGAFVLEDEEEPAELVTEVNGFHNVSV